MSRRKFSLFALVLSVLVLSSCSGLSDVPGGGGGTGGGGSGNTGVANLTITMISEAQSSQTSFEILAFSAQITSLTLNVSGGNAMPLTLTPTPYPVDFNRLTTDTALFGTFSVPAATTFGSMTMALSNITVTIANNGATAIGTCAAGAVCEFTFAPQNATIIANEFPAKYNSATNNNIYFSVRPDNIVTVTNGNLAVDFTKTNFVASQLLPRIGVAPNTIDTIEDFTGVVTAISASSISVVSGNKVGLTAALAGTTAFDDPQSICTNATHDIPHCVTVGTIVSLDGSVSTTGVLTASEIDLIDLTTVDAIEGTIFATSPGNFALIVTDKQEATNGLAGVAQANIGDIFTVNGLATAPFSVDTKTLTTATPIVPVNLFQGTGDILNGQTVRLHVTAASGSASSNNQTLTASTVQLRFSRFTGSTAAPAGSLLNVSFIGAFFQLQPSTQAVAQIYSPQTVVDKLTSLSSIGGPGTSPLVSIRGLMLNSSTRFYMTKVRDQ